MRVQFSVGTGRDENIDQIITQTKLAERYGFSHITFVDQQNLSRDVYAMMAVAALNTSRIQIGQGVTVPHIRHPSVTANATATIHELSGGRAFLGIGSGGNALRSMGMEAHPMKEYREVVEFIRRLLTGKHAEFKVVEMRSEWINKRIPVYMAAIGPTSCRLAGELADGVIIGPGIHPELVKWRIEQIHRGAEIAGRDPSQIEIWVRTMIYITDNKEDAFTAASSYGNRGPYYLFKYKNPYTDELFNRLNNKIPDLEGLIGEFEKFFYSYDDYQHELPNSPHSKLVTQRMIDFVHLVGNSKEIQQKIQELVLLGVTNISTVLFTITNKMEMMQEISKSIMPEFRS